MLDFSDENLMKHVALVKREDHIGSLREVHGAVSETDDAFRKLFNSLLLWSHVLVNIDRADFVSDEIDPIIKALVSQRAFLASIGQEIRRLVDNEWSKIDWKADAQQVDTVNKEEAVTQ